MEKYDYRLVVGFINSDRTLTLNNCTEEGAKNILKNILEKKNTDECIETDTIFISCKDVTFALCEPKITTPNHSC